MSPAARVSPTATVAENVDIHPGATVGDRCEIGPGTTVHAGVQIMADCVIGAGVTLFPNAVLYENTRVGDRAIVAFPYLLKSRAWIGGSRGRPRRPVQTGVRNSRRKAVT